MASTAVSTPSSEEHTIYCLGDFLYIKVLPDIILKVRKNNERNYAFIKSFPEGAVPAKKLDHWDCKKTTPEEDRWIGAAGPVRNLINVVISLRELCKE